MTARNQPQRRHTLVTLLACGATVAQAAAQAHVSERTVYRYLADPEFRQQLQTLQAETVQCTAARLTAAAPEALKVLIESQAPSMPPSVRRAAARALMDLSRRHREAITLEKRLQALEQQQRQADTLPAVQSRAPEKVSASQAAPPPPANPASRPRRKKAVYPLLNMLACGASVAQAAAKAKVSTRTVYRRLADPEFREQLRTLQAEMTQRAADLLLAGTVQATRTLLDLLAPTTPANIRRAAARDILELGLGLRQAVELEERLAVVEVGAGLRLAG